MTWIYGKSETLRISNLVNLEQYALIYPLDTDAIDTPLFNIDISAFHLC